MPFSPHQSISDVKTGRAAPYLEAQYHGKTTMVAPWFGALLDELDAQGLWDDTLVIFTTDGRHDLGERGVFAKQYPHRDSHANIPMIAWDPRKPGNGQVVAALAQAVDIFVMCSGAAGGTPSPQTRYSKSLLDPLSSGDAPRSENLFGTFGQGVCITDGDRTLFKSPVESKPLYSYSTMITRPLLVDNPVDGRLGPSTRQGSIRRSPIRPRRSQSGSTHGPTITSCSIGPWIRSRPGISDRPRC